MAAGIVVGGILLATDEKFRVEELAVATSSDLVNGRGVQIDEEGTGNVFATTGLREEGFVGAAIEDTFGIGIRATIKSEAVLKKVPRRGGRVVSSAQFPT